jgi:hypothetical protein
MPRRVKAHHVPRDQFDDEKHIDHPEEQINHR